MGQPIGFHSRPRPLNPDSCGALTHSPGHLSYHCSYQGRTSLLFRPVPCEGLFGNCFGKRSYDSWTRTVSCLQDLKHQPLSSSVVFDLSRPPNSHQVLFPCKTSQKDKRLSRYGRCPGQQGLSNGWGSKSQPYFWLLGELGVSHPCPRRASVSPQRIGRTFCY